MKPYKFIDRLYTDYEYKQNNTIIPYCKIYTG